MGIVAGGRLKRGPERELCEKYLNRFAKTGSFSGFSFDGVREIPESRAANAQSRRREEAGCLDQSRGGGQTVILLDEIGENINSRDFAELLADLRDEGVKRCAFAVGGSDGRDPSMRRAAHRVLSFGGLTWPHQLARIVLAGRARRQS